MRKQPLTPYTLPKGVGAEVFIVADGNGEFLVRPALVAVQRNEKLLFWNLSGRDVEVAAPGARKVSLGPNSSRSVVVSKPLGAYPYVVSVDLGKGRLTRARGDSPPRVVVRP